MPWVERVRAWADGATEPHTDDEQALAACRASDDPVLRAAAATHLAVGHLDEFRFEEARAASASAVALIVEALDGPITATGVDPVQIAGWAWYVHAESLDELGSYDAAAASAEASAGLADAHLLELTWGRAISKRIWIARQQGDASTAAALLRQLAARLSPRSHLLCSALGSTLAWLGRPETALRYAQRCLTLPGGQGRRARDHRDLARIFMRLERFDEARRQLDLAAAELAKRHATLAGSYMLMYAEYQLALACGDHAAAERIATEAIAGVADTANLRRHQAQLGLAQVHALQGRVDAATAALRGIDTDRLGAELRALARRLEAAAAEHDGDWQRAARALGEAREILAARHLTTPAVLLIEAELAVADPFAAELMPGGADGLVSEFNRALATRDQLLMAAAKDLRGPIAVFELGAELLTEPDTDAERVAALVERGLAEMELLVSQLRDTELGASADGPSTDGGHTLGDVLMVAMQQVAPIAAARDVTIELRQPTDAIVSRATATVTSALTTVLALAVRGARRATTVTIDAVTPRAGQIELDLIAGDAAPAGWTALDSVTAATAGGPTAWRLAVNQLAEADGGVTAEWAAGHHVRVRFDPGS